VKIFFGTDHAGFEMKEMLLVFVRDALGHEVEDMGAFEYNEGDDYPDFIREVAERVGEADVHGKAQSDVYGIILGGSGQGEAMAANRYKGVRAAVFYGGNADILTLSREHNDANILSLGARFLLIDEAKEAVALWLDTQFSGEERHVRRIKKIDSLA
jgi:ribose 5-phosphate isomerase B